MQNLFFETLIVLHYGLKENNSKEDTFFPRILSVVSFQSYSVMTVLLLVFCFQPYSGKFAVCKLVLDLLS